MRLVCLKGPKPAQTGEALAEPLVVPGFKREPRGVLQGKMADAVRVWVFVRLMGWNHHF